MGPLRKLAKWVTRLPDSVSMLLIVTSVLAGAVAGSVVWYQHQITTAERRGERRITDLIKVDSVLRTMAGVAFNTATTRTDTVLVTVAARAARVDSQAIAAALLARRLPPSLDTFPQVRELQLAVIDLSASVTMLTTTLRDTVQQVIDVERAAARLYVDAAKAEAVDLQLALVVTQDTVRSLEKRPTRKEEVVVAGAFTIIGYAIHKLVQAVAK